LRSFNVLPVSALSEKRTSLKFVLETLSEDLTGEKGKCNFKGQTAPFLFIAKRGAGGDARLTEENALVSLCEKAGMVRVDSVAVVLRAHVTVGTGYVSSAVKSIIS
jgi:hypothetical protein